MLRLLCQTRMKHERVLQMTYSRLLQRTKVVQELAEMLVCMCCGELVWDVVGL